MSLVLQPTSVYRCRVDLCSFDWRTWFSTVLSRGPLRVRPGVASCRTDAVPSRATKSWREIHQLLADVSITVAIHSVQHAQV